MQAIDTGNANANVNNPTNNFFSNSQPTNLYQNNPSSLVTLKAGTITNTGGSQPHLNMQPFLTISFCIALQGIFPSQN
jgi:microcystin-dependent protein